MKKQIIITSALGVLLPLAAFAQTPSATTTPAAPATQSIPPAELDGGTVKPAEPAPPAPPPLDRSMAKPPAPAPPDPVPRVGAPGRDRDEGPKEPVTFLGVETSEVPRVLSEQMNLPRGFGVVVDYVVPASAAASSGLQQSDIIRMLNDQQIVNPGQLGKLVRSFPDGTTVNFTVMRKGQEMKMPVKLGKKDVSAGRGRSGFEQQWNFDDFDKMDFDFKAPDMTAVREAVVRAKDQAMRARDQAEKAVRRLRIVTKDDDVTKTTKIDLGRATVTFSDDEGELKMENLKGRKTLTAKDAQGNMLYNGPIETPEDRAKLPAHVRQRLEKLENQELPSVPEAPVPPAPPAPPRPPEAGASARLQGARYEKAGFLPSDRSGWRRSTFVL
ncbi:MAG: PDZ domain-containing protein [Chthoniobacterales bacterium]